MAILLLRVRLADCL